MRYNRLYDCFKHWYRGGEIHLYSDPHFNDDEMKYLRENYIGDDEQIKRINSVIGKKDTLIILGDIGDVEYLKQVRGYKILILGNHDKGASVYRDVVDEIYTGPLIISDKIILSHQKIVLPYLFNIHGHEHSGTNSETTINMCAENINYTPIRLSDILLSENFRNMKNIHRQQIDRSSQKEDN